MQDYDPLEPIKLLTKRQAADMLGFSTTTLNRLIAAGHIQAIRPAGGPVRIHRREIERYIAEADTVRPSRA